MDLFVLVLLVCLNVYDQFMGDFMFFCHGKLFVLCCHELLFLIFFLVLLETKSDNPTFFASFEDTPSANM